MRSRIFSQFSQQNVAASLGLYNNDFLSIDILHERGPITAGELSKLTGLATGSVTALIDRLENNRFCAQTK